MDIQVTANIANTLAQLAKKPAQIERAAAKAVRAAGNVLFDEDKRQVNAIYARPIPKRKNGKPMWVRKGTLRRGEALVIVNPLIATIMQRPDEPTPYAEARHALDRPGADGITRHDPWRDLTVEKATAPAIAKFEQVFGEEMSK